jgi:hypothetical protein
MELILVSISNAAISSNFSITSAVYPHVWLSQARFFPLSIFDFDF